ncbi:serine--tRNA ligase, chloroplastic/mitochondrial [Cladorrhinum sp. PSN332]|nr:serine--tRNA ligase, chloroplastic/mitochondrial [Cladorrhinum sp. PSN332]
MRPSIAGASRPFTCLQCLARTSPRRPIYNIRSAAAFSRSARPLQADTASPSTTSELPPQQSSPLRPTIAPKPLIDIKHIRQNPDLYSQNCIDRNYKSLADHPAKINSLFAEWQAQQRAGRALRERGNLLRRQLTHASAPGATSCDEPSDLPEDLLGLTKEQVLEEARKVKAGLQVIEDAESKLQTEMERLALVIPNLTSEQTPRGTEPEVLSYINDHPEPEPAVSDRVWRSHVHVGAELGLLDFAAAASSSGWGWYYLLDEAAQLEQALVSFALATTTRAGWRHVSPPSVVYSHIASACGFQPRDTNGEPTQIYGIRQSSEDIARGKPELVLAGTAEIPLAGMKADMVLDESDMPMKRVAVSRCYRAEAGARGSETKGLYRVHEFTKVEMFAWTSPEEFATEEVFDEMVDLQTEILGSLGLHCRILEMPTADLGASATRKVDIEAFFPSRRERNDGWGEVTSASVCTDYQTRRLATRLKVGGKLVYPWTVNGTALAVPRVLAAILENGWDEDEKSVTIPEVLRPWMDGREKIGPRHHLN